MKKKKMNPFMPTFALAGGSLGMGMVGGAVASKLPAGMANPFTSAGNAMTPFIAPAASLGGAAMTMGLTKKLVKSTKGVRF